MFPEAKSPIILTVDGRFGNPNVGTKLGEPGMYSLGKFVVCTWHDTPEVQLFGGLYCGPPTRSPEDVVDVVSHNNLPRLLRNVSEEVPDPKMMSLVGGGRLQMIDDVLYFSERSLNLGNVPQQLLEACVAGLPPTLQAEIDATNSYTPGPRCEWIAGWYRKIGIEVEEIKKKS